MRRTLSLLWLLAAGLVPASAATTPLYIINSPVISPPDIAPQIDATAVVCRSLFDYRDFGLTPIPYQFLNNRFFTNEPAGRLSATPGFRFDNFNHVNNTRRTMDYWTNQGPISSSQFLLVNATNIASTGGGSLTVGPAGLMRLEGRNINLPRVALRAGDATNTFFGGGFLINNTNYVNETGVTDLWWGAGTNNRVVAGGPNLVLNGFNQRLDVPGVRSPLHQVIQLFFGRPFTNLISLPRYNSGFDSYGVFVHTNSLNATSYMVQAVFVPTNNVDPNISTDVRFFPGGNSGPAAVAIQFSSGDFDQINNAFTSNHVYLVDRMAVETNVFLLRNVTSFLRPTGLQRPNVYEVTRSMPFEFALGGSANAAWTNTLLSNSSLISNSVSHAYAGYGAEIAGVTNVPLNAAPEFDPTNFAGRVEIIGDKVNLEQTRIRAESTIIVKAKDLTSNRVARVDAPYLAFDLTSTQPQLIISNLAPSSIHRMSGPVAAWSATWSNVETNDTRTNTVLYHVLICDNALASQQQVVMNEFTARATNLIIRDDLFLRKSVLLDSRGLEISGTVAFPQPSDWANTNVPNLYNFTNHGTLALTGSASYGTDRPQPYSNWVNTGVNTAVGQFIRTRYLDNPGALNSSNGMVSIDALTANFNGRITSLFTNVSTNLFIDFFTGLTNSVVTTNVFTNSIGSKVASTTTVRINAHDMTASNSVFLAGQGFPAPLEITVTNRLVDGGVAAANEWHTTGGFSLTRRPATSDLLGTHLTSVVRDQGQSFHSWAALDRGGTNNTGFTNNAALGHLTLDGNFNTFFQFSGAGGGAGPRALYVDYIELLNQATNITTDAYFVDPSFTIYFAHANVAADKLNGAVNGRFVWVSTFTGPRSSTNITYPSGTTYTFNTSLVQSKDLDSDGDGTVNADDPTPILTGETVGLTVSLASGPPAKALLAWYAPTSSVSLIEFSTNVPPTWGALQSLTNRAESQILNYCDPAPLSSMRVYRVRVDRFVP